MPPGPLKIKEKCNSTDAPPSDMLTYTVKLYLVRPLLRCQCSIVHACWSSVTPCRELLCRCSCNKYDCWLSVTVTNTSTVQICLLVDFCCKTDAYWTGSSQSVCLSLFCHSILRHAGLSGNGLAGVVSHYQPCLLVWCLNIEGLTIGHAFWCCASSSAMPSDVWPH